MIPFARSYGGAGFDALIISFGVAVAIYFTLWLFKKLFRKPTDSDDSDDEDEDADADSNDLDD
jgi:hypothetical protein